MYSMIMDFDKDELRIPKDVAEALSMPTDFGWFVHRGDRQIAIMRYMDPEYLHGTRRRPAKRKSRLPGYWRDDADAYCVSVVRVMLQMIGNLITGFDGSGVYVLANPLFCSTWHRRHPHGAFNRERQRRLFLLCRCVYYITFAKAKQ